MGEALTIEARHEHGYPVVTVAGEIDIATAARLRERLAELAAGGRPLVADLDQVRFIDSAGLAALVGAANRAAAHGGSLHVVCARPKVRQLFPPNTGGAKLVDRQPGGHGGEERARGCDLLACIERPMHAQQRLLHDVLGLGDAAEHPVGDRECDRPQLVEQSLALGHDAANP